MLRAGEREGAGRELDRLVFFSDAVFAIAITILVLDIRVPDIPEGLVARELPMQVIGLWPKYVSYAISFLVLAVYWQAHHRVFRPIERYDGTLVWLNFFFLMAVAFLPFPTSLIGEYAGERVSVAIYAANAALASLLLVATSWYATAGRRLVAPDHDLEAEKLQRAQGLAVPVVFLASIGVSFFSPMAATYSWLLLIFTDPIVRAVWRR
jgi:uncharacterized membrane protein